MKIISIFTGGGHAGLKTIKQFVKDSSFVIAADSGLETVDKLGIMPSFIVGDMDSLKNKSLLRKYSCVNTEIFPAEKDFTDTELAFNCARSLKPEAIYLFGGGGGRADHFLSLIRLFDGELPPSVWLSRHNLCFCIGGKSPASELEITLPENAALSVFPSGDIKKGSHKILSEGLHWQLSAVNWQTSVSQSNKPAADKNRPGQSRPVRLSAKQGSFIIFIYPSKKYPFMLTA